MPPAMPPSAPSGTVSHRRARCPAKSRRWPSTPPTMPGHSATVLVTLAAMAGIPIAVNAGNDISVPPPAIAFTQPAAIPARATRPYCSAVGVIEAGPAASPGDYVARPRIGWYHQGDERAGRGRVADRGV